MSAVDAPTAVAASCANVKSPTASSTAPHLPVPSLSCHTRTTATEDTTYHIAMSAAKGAAFAAPAVAEANAEVSFGAIDDAQGGRSSGGWSPVAHLSARGEHLSRSVRGEHLSLRATDDGAP